MANIKLNKSIALFFLITFIVIQNNLYSQMGAGTCVDRYCLNTKNIIGDSCFVGIQTLFPLKPLHIHGFREELEIDTTGSEATLIFTYGVHDNARCKIDGDTLKAYISLTNPAFDNLYSTVNLPNDFVIQTSENTGSILLTTRNNESAIKFATTPTPSASDLLRMIINPNGHVGINTPAPLQRLHVNGKVRIDTLLAPTHFFVTADSTGVLGKFPFDSAISVNFYGWGLDGNNIADTNFLGTLNEEDLVIKTDNEERMRITSDGALLYNSLTGATPIEGQGKRMMWIPDKVAFRAGQLAGIGAADFWDNDNIGQYSFAFGFNPIASGDNSFAAGRFSVAEGIYSVALGHLSRAIGTNSVALGSGVAEGNFSLAFGPNSFSKGNYSKAISGLAEGDYSVSIGNFAKALNHGSFVFADKPIAFAPTWNLESDEDNQITMRFTGDGTDNSVAYRFFTDTLHTIGAIMDAYSSGWQSLSDRSIKTNIKEINGEGILESLKRVPVTTWSYKNAPQHKRYMGPMAQDFYREFKLGGNDSLTINTINIDGVNMAAIKALIERTDKLQTENDELKEKLSLLELYLKEKHNHELNEFQQVYDEIILEQNRPNPFNNSTEITYIVPNTVKGKATLKTYNLSGNIEIEAFELRKGNIGTILIDGSKYSTGTYIYTLSVDEVIVKTMKMISSK